MWSFWWHCCYCHKRTSTCREGSSIYPLENWTLLDLQHHPQSLQLHQPALWPPLFYICQHGFWYILIMYVYIYLSGILFFLLLVTYLQWNSRTPSSELCPLLPLSFPWRGALVHQLPTSSQAEDLACHPAAQLRWWWNTVNHLWPLRGRKLEVIYLRQVLGWARRMSWRGLTSSFPLRL